MTYNAKLRDSIHDILSQEPTHIEEVARRTGYSVQYIHEHLMYIRRDIELDWTVRFIGHGNQDKLTIVKLGEMNTGLNEEAIKVGNDSWLATTENKCIALRKHCELAMETVVSPEAKRMYAQLAALMGVAEIVVRQANVK